MGVQRGRLDVRVGVELAALADHLAAHLEDQHRDVLAREVLVVPTPGIGRWVSRRLSRRLGATEGDDGVFANVDVLLFSAFLDRAVGTVQPDPWSLETMTLRALASLSASPVAAPLRRLLDERPGALRLPVARACADLFDQLFRWRPDVAEAWLAGDDADPRAALLRSLAAGTDEAPPHRRLDDALARLRAGDVVALPRCVHLFGHDGLPGGPRTPELLDALSASRDVLVHLVTPSTRRFEHLRGSTSRYDGAPPPRTQADEPGVDLLVRSWGTGSADAARLVAQLPARETTSIELHQASRDDAASLLGALHAALRDGAVDVRPPDGTVRFHSCVGALRQVEVARDAVLHALREDPTLRPSDVAILCADLPRFAPHLEAVLGRPGEVPALPFVLRDRSLSRTVPLVAALGGILSLLAGRFTRSAVLDLCASAGVRRRFGLELADLDGIVAWMDDAGVNWGLDPQERAEAGLPADFEAGTWRRALDRVLAGVALPPDAEATSLGVRPVGVGHDLEPLEVLCELLAILEDLRRSCAEPRTIAGWCEVARAAAEALVATEPTEAKAWWRLDELLDGLAQDARDVDADVPFEEFRALYADRAAATRELAAAGQGVTITSFAPLRNVPFRVVVLLGMDDVSLSRGAARDGAFGAPRVGDRDPRGELRGALLAAVLSASDQLVVTFDGADVVTNERVARTTALSELMDAAARVCEEGVAPLVLAHPRHAHGRGELESLGDGPFSFDPGALQRARELEQAPRRSGARVRIPPTEVLVEERTRPRQLAEVLRSAQRCYLGASLRLAVPRDLPVASDDVPVSVDDLTTWRLVSDLVALGLVAGARQLPDDEWRRFCDEFARQPDGMLASLPGRLGASILHGRDGIAQRARQLLAAVETAQGGPDGELRDVEVVLPAGTVAGSVQVFKDSRVVVWTASATDDKVRIDAAVELLCLTAAQPEHEWLAYPICRAKDGARSPRPITLQPLAVPGESPDERAATARALLDRLMAIRHVALREPVPLFFRATMRMRTELAKKPELARPALVDAAEACWDSEYGATDRTDASVRYCFDGSFRELCELPVRPGDPDVDARAEGSRLLAYSLAVCDALRTLERPREEVPA